MTNSSVNTLSGDSRDIAEIVADCAQKRLRVSIAGGGTRSIPYRDVDRLHLSTRKMSGIVSYEPGELTLIAGAGTPLEEVEQVLRQSGQMLAFEPFDHQAVMGSSGTPTIGGAVAANVSGPRRVLVGACRDHVLGLSFVDGQGRIIKAGGRVMKNVTGLDLSRILCGSHGRLGVITQVALKTLPMPEDERTIVVPDVSAECAMAIFATVLATPYEVSGAAYMDRHAWIRVEGLSPQVEYRVRRLSTLLREFDLHVVDASASSKQWRDFRNKSAFAGHTGSVWRIKSKPTNAVQILRNLEKLGGASSTDWGGATIWYFGTCEDSDVRAAAAGATVQRVRSANDEPPKLGSSQPSSVSALEAVIERVFDPTDVFGQGRG